MCIWQYILQNYNYKLHFQNLSIYHIPHVFMGTLAPENFDVCTACDQRDSNIQLTMVKDRRRQIYLNIVQCQGVFGPFGLILISDPPGAGMPFLDSDTCPSGGFLPCMMPSMDGWQDIWMDEWMDGSHDEKASQKMTMTSFTICNVFS